MCVSEEEKQMRDSKKKHVKFDVVIGNPPYQEDAHGEQKTFTPSIYNHFMDDSYNVSGKVVLITPARFLFNAGNTPHKWNKKMLNDPHFKVLQYFSKSDAVFPHTDIKGGVAVSIRNNDVAYGAIETFTPFTELSSILRKVKPDLQNGNISDIIYIQNKFNLNNLYEDHPEYKSIIGSHGKDKRFRNNIFEKIDAFTTEKEYPDDIQVIGLIKGKRVWRYIPQKYVDMAHENINTYKVLVPQANGSGALGEVLSTPLIGTPLIGYTQTFIGFGSYSTQREAEACLKYIKTKFARVLLGTLKITQSNGKNTWCNIPLQNFTSSSDIDWTKSVHEIDLQLYKKYNLSQKEIDFIEQHVKGMD